MASDEGTGRSFARAATSTARQASSSFAGDAGVGDPAGAGVVPGEIVRDLVTRQFGRINRVVRLKPGEQLEPSSL